MRHLAIKIQVCLSNMLGLFAQRFLTTPCNAEIMVAAFKQTPHQVVNCWAENAGFCWDFSPVRAGLTRRWVLQLWQTLRVVLMEVLDCL